MTGLDRRAAVRALLDGRGDALVVCGLGSPGYDVFAAGDELLEPVQGGRPLGCGRPRSEQAEELFGGGFGRLGWGGGGRRQDS